MLVKADDQLIAGGLWESAVAALFSLRLLLGGIKNFSSEATLDTVPAVARGDLTHLHQLINVPCEQLESTLHIAVALGRSLHVADTKFGRQLLRLVPRHLAVVAQVALVADKDVDHVMRQDVLANLSVPFPHMIEGLPVRQVEN